MAKEGTPSSTRGPVLQHEIQGQDSADDDVLMLAVLNMVVVVMMMVMMKKMGILITIERYP